MILKNFTMKKIIRTVAKFILLIPLLLLACSPSEDVQICNSDHSIILEFGSCLVFEDNGELDNERENIGMIIRETVALVNSKMPVENLNILVRVAPSDVIPEIGIGGFNPNENEIIISIDLNFPNLTQSISIELAPLIAHEMHHAKRRRTIGYGSNLLEASVSEGLADCFSMEIIAIDPPIWSVAITGTELEDLINTAKNTWENKPYDHSKWFFGSTPDIPRWAGYAIGFDLVKKYLSENPTRKPSDLVNEPASSFAQ